MGDRSVTVTIEPSLVYTESPGLSSPIVAHPVENRSEIGVAIGVSNGSALPEPGHSPDK